MAYEMKEGEITVFENQKSSDKQPDYKGSLMINGQLKDVALWRKESANGSIRWSGTVKEPYKKTEQRSEQQPSKEDNSDLPF